MDSCEGYYRFKQDPILDTTGILRNSGTTWIQLRLLQNPCCRISVEITPQRNLLDLEESSDLLLSNNRQFHSWSRHISLNLVLQMCYMFKTQHIARPVVISLCNAPGSAYLIAFSMYITGNMDNYMYEVSSITKVFPSDFMRRNERYPRGNTYETLCDKIYWNEDLIITS